MTHPTTPTPSQQTGSTALWAAIVVLAVVVGALASALYFVQTQKQVLHDANLQQQGAASASAPQPDANKAADASKAADVAPIKTTAEPSKPAAKKPVAAEAKVSKPADKPHSAVSKSAPAAAPAAVAAPAPYTGEPIPAPAAARELCPNCATVVSVTPIEREAATGGAGAVAGGLLGALVGNQFGQGQGKDIATVVGAIGGDIVGNNMEKKTKKITAYQVQVRMDDGNTRFLELAEPYGVGVRVRVEGNTLRTLL